RTWGFRLSNEEVKMKRLTRGTVILALLLSLLSCGYKSGNSKPSDTDYYTCTMHPSVHSEAPGKCPICGMELVPVMKRSVTGGNDAQTMSSPKRNSDRNGMSGMAGMPMNETNKPAGNPGEFVVPVERQQQIGVTYAAVE